MRQIRMLPAAAEAHKIGRAGPRLTQLHQHRLAYLRNAVEHSDEKLLGMGLPIRSGPRRLVAEAKPSRACKSDQASETDASGHEKIRVRGQLGPRGWPSEFRVRGQRISRRPSGVLILVSPPRMGVS
jgi:hypothetical protein